MELPGDDLHVSECPREVLVRGWAIAHLFQHWNLEALHDLVEGWQSVADDFTIAVRTVFGCGVEDLVLMREDADPSAVLSRCKTASGDVVYRWAIGPLLESRQGALRTFIAFNQRYNHARSSVLGPAFDFEVELT